MDTKMIPEDAVRVDYRPSTFSETFMFRDNGDNIISTVTDVDEHPRSGGYSPTFVHLEHNDDWRYVPGESVFIREEMNDNAPPPALRLVVGVRFNMAYVGDEYIRFWATYHQDTLPLYNGDPLYNTAKNWVRKTFSEVFNHQDACGDSVYALV